MLRSFKWLFSISRLAILPLLIFFGGCSTLFPIDAGESLEHFYDESPEEGSTVKPFKLTSLDGDPVELEQLIGDKPIVIQLGSYTCPVFRYRRFDMIPLREKFKDQVTFLVIYTQEAHPVGDISPYSDEEWVPWMNKIAGVDNGQAVSFDERAEQASNAKENMQSNAIFLVDDMDNGTWMSLGRAPSAAFVLDLEGKVVLRQPWVYPKEIDSTLTELLSEN